MRITDQVIEEVDEQATITSQRGNDNRPNVRDIFNNGPVNTASAGGGVGSPPKHSDPMDIPLNKNKIYMRTQSTVEPSLFPPGGVDALLSSSAPVSDVQHLARTVPTTPTGYESARNLYDRENMQTRANSHETGKLKQFNNLKSWGIDLLTTYYL